MALKKQCSWRGCKALVNDGVQCCPLHTPMLEQLNRERYKEYDKRRNKDKDRQKYSSLYSSGEWDAVRTYVIQSRYGMDILEYYRTGRVVEGERVHHIVCLEDDWRRRLEPENLIYLKEKNHRQIHAEYDKGTKEKKKMQSILFSLIERFESEYGPGDQ